MCAVSCRAAARRVAAGLCLGAAALAAHAGALAPELERALAMRGTHADTAIIVRFTDPLDQRPFTAAGRNLRDNRLLVALKARAARNRRALEPFLHVQGATRIKDLWIINGLATTLPAVAVRQLAAQPGVERVDLDSFVQGGRPQRMPPPRSHAGGDRPAAAPQAAVVQAAPSAAPGWNIQAVHAPPLWAMGQTGKGVVVATMDTGVDLSHPDLASKWRGGANSWFDPHGEETQPYDALGHGTQSMGVILGGSGLGIAPDARWIAVRIFNSAARSSMSDIHLAFQWLMDPDGDVATLDAPDVVNASWALTGRAAGSCILEFSDDTRALRNAGIVVVFAAGNDGPAAGTSSSPANNPGALSVGAVTRELAIARQTSRGPSACDGGIFPRLLAPGVDVRTADLSYGGVPSYTYVSGSSLAAPHVAGAMALLAAAFPGASVADLEAALTESAGRVQPAANATPDRTGLLDVQAAFERLRRRPELAAPSGGLPLLGAISLAKGAMQRQESGPRRAP